MDYDLSFDPTLSHWNTKSGSVHAVPGRVTATSDGWCSFEQHPGEHPAWAGFTPDLCQLSGPIVAKNGDTVWFQFDLNVPAVALSQFGWFCPFEVHQDPTDHTIVQGSPMVQLDVAGGERLIVRGQGNGGQVWKSQVTTPDDVSFCDGTPHRHIMGFENLDGDPTSSYVSWSVDGVPILNRKQLPVGFDNCSYYPKIGVYRKEGNPGVVTVKARGLNVTHDSITPIPPASPQPLDEFWTYMVPTPPYRSWLKTKRGQRDRVKLQDFSKGSSVVPTLETDFGDALLQTILARISAGLPSGVIKP